MSERTAKDVVAEMFERRQAGDLTSLDDLVASDMINHAAGPRGRVEHWACRNDMGRRDQLAT